MKKEDAAIFGGGLVLGGTGVATVAGATGTGIVATGITNVIAAAPAIGKLGLLIGSFPALAPAAIVAGAGFLVYSVVKHFSNE